MYRSCATGVSVASDARSFVSSFAPESIKKQGDLKIVSNDPNITWFCVLNEDYFSFWPSDDEGGTECLFVSDVTDFVEVDDGFDVTFDGEPGPLRCRTSNRKDQDDWVVAWSSLVADDLGKKFIRLARRMAVAATPSEAKDQLKGFGTMASDAAAEHEAVHESDDEVDGDCILKQGEVKEKRAVGMQEFFLALTSDFLSYWACQADLDCDEEKPRDIIEVSSIDAFEETEDGFNLIIQGEAQQRSLQVSDATERATWLSAWDNLLGYRLGDKFRRLVQQSSIQEGDGIVESDGGTGSALGSTSKDLTDAHAEHRAEMENAFSIDSRPRTSTQISIAADTQLRVSMHGRTSRVSQSGVASSSEDGFSQQNSTDRELAQSDHTANLSTAVSNTSALAAADHLEGDLVGDTGGAQTQRSPGQIRDDTARSVSGVVASEEVDESANNMPSQRHSGGTGASEDEATVENVAAVRETSASLGTADEPVLEDSDVEVVDDRQLQMHSEVSGKYDASKDSIPPDLPNNGTKDTSASSIANIDGNEATHDANLASPDLESQSAVGASGHVSTGHSNLQNASNEEIGAHHASSIVPDIDKLETKAEVVARSESRTTVDDDGFDGDNVGTFVNAELSIDDVGLIKGDEESDVEVIRDPVELQAHESPEDVLTTVSQPQAHDDINRNHEVVEQHTRSSPDGTAVRGSIDHASKSSLFEAKDEEAHHIEALEQREIVIEADTQSNAMNGKGDSKPRESLSSGRVISSSGVAAFASRSTRQSNLSKGSSSPRQASRSVPPRTRSSSGSRSAAALPIEKVDQNVGRRGFEDEERSFSARPRQSSQIDEIAFIEEPLQKRSTTSRNGVPSTSTRTSRANSGRSVIQNGQLVQGDVERQARSPSVKSARASSTSRLSGSESGCGPASSGSSAKMGKEAAVLSGPPRCAGPRRQLEGSEVRRAKSSTNSPTSPGWPTAIQSSSQGHLQCISLMDNNFVWRPMSSRGLCGKITGIRSICSREEPGCMSWTKIGHTQWARASGGNANNAATSTTLGTLTPRCRSSVTGKVNMTADCEHKKFSAGSQPVYMMKCGSGTTTASTPARSREGSNGSCSSQRRSGESSNYPSVGGGVGHTGSIARSSSCPALKTSRSACRRR